MSFNCALEFILTDDDTDGRMDEDCEYLPNNHTYLAVFMENTVEEPAANIPLRMYGASYHTQVLHVYTPMYRYDGMFTTLYK